MASERVALLGHPVAQSRSPRMQNAAFAAAGLDWEYTAIDVELGGLLEAVRNLVHEGFRGANVTAPHKVAAFGACDEVDERAERAESVNTLVFRDGRVLGTTTDTEALDEVDGTTAVLLGGGGAARAWRAALESRGMVVRPFARSGAWPPDPAGTDVIVNATPVKDELLVEPGPQHAVIDLPYNGDGTETALVTAARAVGSRTVVDGLEVLARQGAAAFELWTGVEAPLDVMRSAVRV
ncbi:MAG: shikimate dehydrogenase family protein [Gaiellaceae bacterium]